MTVAVTVTWHNAGPYTIHGRLAARLGREPTNAEAREEVLRILRGDPEPALSPSHTGESRG